MNSTDLFPITDDLPLSTVWKKYFPKFSRETIERWCRNKTFKTAYKPGGTPRSQWRVSRAEVISHSYRTSNEFLSTKES